ncbi:MAG: cadherin repeat domain-containing protein [Pseudoxanthomonas sp.]
MAKTQRLIIGLATACLVLATSGCGGGGDDGGNSGNGGTGSGGGGTPAPANQPPVFTSATTASVAENSTGAFYTAKATDANNDALTYSISGGADRARFSITSGGALSFVASPDYEAPTDSDGNNVYLVELSVSDGKGGSATLSLSVTVTDVAEGTTPTPPTTSGALPRFPPAAVWHQNISNAALHPQSAVMISTLAGLGGFGGGRMQIDFSMHVVRAPANAPMRTIVGYPSSSEYYSPDCDTIGTQMPVPTTGAIEGSSNLSCDNNNGDCHLLVWQGNRLYEAYRANASGASNLQSQCLAVWKLDSVYPDSGRGEHCTSADAAGFPVAPLLFNADEIYSAMQTANSDLGHAIRFILPNNRMGTVGGRRAYVRPASHAGGPSGPENSVPYGSRLRLRADFPVSQYSAGAQVVLRTMQRYGIVLADGGNIALTAESDLFTTHSWRDVGITAQTFYQQVPSAAVKIEDFQVLDTGARIIETYDCVRNTSP